MLSHVPDRPAVRLLEGALPAAARDGTPDLRLRAARATGRTSATSTSTGRRTSTRSTSGCGSTSPGIRLRGNIWLGEGVEIDDLDAIEGPAFIGNYCRIAPRRRPSAPYSVLSNGVTLRERARTTRSVIDAATHIGRSSAARGRDRRPARATSATTSASTRAWRSATRSRSAPSRACMPGVRIYPYKEVETGAQIYESLIWESRARSRLFGKDGVGGPRERRPDARDGRPARRGARHGARSAARASVASRESGAGLPDDQARADHRPERRPGSTWPTCASRRAGQPARAEDAGFAARRPRGHERDRSRGRVQIRIFEPPGIQLTAALQKEIEKHFTRQELRRVALRRGGRRSPIRRASARATRRTCSTRLDVDAIRARGFRIVVDYGYSAASFVASARARPARRRGGLGARRSSPRGASRRQSLARVDRPGEAARRRGRRRPRRRLRPRAPSGSISSTSTAREVPVEQALLLFVRLLAAQRPRTGKVAFPITVTSQVDRIVEGSGSRSCGRPQSLADLTRAAAAATESSSPEPSAAATCSPSSCPRYDAVASLVQAARAARARRAAALRARRRAARVRRWSTASSPAPGRSRASSCASSTSASPAGERRPDSTGSRSSTSAAGCRCCPTRTSRSCTSTPREKPRRARRSSSRSSAARRGRSCRETAPTARTAVEVSS